MKNDTLYLAADSGGSKTLWTLINSCGEEVFQFKTEGLGAVKAGVLPIDKTVSEAARAILNAGKPTAIHLALGGPNTEEVSYALSKVFKDIPVKVEREACGDSILLAAGFFDCSAVVMCGTGSTAVGENENGRCFSGGWGPIYGDGGSGGGLGSSALKLFLKSVDGGADAGGITSLFSELTQDLDIKSFDGRMELKSRALALTRRQLAALAPEIYKLKIQGDKTAQMLYSEAAREVAFMAQGVSRNDEVSGVLLCGGFFANKPEFIEECKLYFAEKSNAKMRYIEEFEPIIGIQLNVLKSNSIEITNDIFNTVINNRKTKNGGI